MGAFLTQEVRTDLGFGYSTGIDIAEPGHPITVEWASAAGATGVEVTEALVVLRPAVAIETHEDVPFQADGGGWSITVPANRRVAAIGLSGFRRPGEAEIVSSADIPSGRRISIAFPPVEGGGFDTPRFSVPAVSKQGAVPKTLTGAFYTSRTITLNRPPAAAKTRVALVDGDTPNEFSDEGTELSSVSLTTHSTARNLKVTGPAGEVLFDVAEFDPDASPAEADLRQVLTAIFNKQIGAGQALRAEFMVKADTPARAGVTFGGARGFVARVEEGVLRSVLEGDPVDLALSSPLDPAAPASATGDLTIRYDGIRILEEASDALPDSGLPVAGLIVGAQPALRVFPPQVFAGAAPARVGIFGRAAESCELVLEFVEMAGNTAGAALSPAAVLKVDPDGEVKTRWAALPPGTSIAKPAGLRVRANTGRFYWAANADGAPIVRVAILDPDPAGRPVYLAGGLLAEVASEESHQTAFAFAPAAFAGGPVDLRSDLFLTVDISDLTMRYAR